MQPAPKSVPLMWLEMAIEAVACLLTLLKVRALTDAVLALSTFRCAFPNLYVHLDILRLLLYYVKMDI